MSELLSMARGLKDSYSLSNKQTKNISSHALPCRLLCAGPLLFMQKMEFKGLIIFKLTYTIIDGNKWDVK